MAQLIWHVIIQLLLMASIISQSEGLLVHLLYTILLITSVFDIEIKAHWIPSEENIIANVAS
jgi:hypothetical protein